MPNRNQWHELMIWLLILTVYATGPNAIDSDGPWTLGMTRLVDTHYSSEAECRNAGIQMIGRIHQGMMAPIRAKCVAVDTGLAKGVPR